MRAVKNKLRVRPYDENEELSLAAGIHYRSLDGFRGLAISAVMFSHFIVIGGQLGESPLHRLLQSGYLGVDMLFILSGFLVTLNLLSAKQAKGPYLRPFFIRRVLRVFPLYYALLAVAFLSVPLLTPGDAGLFTGHDSPLWHWLYASNIGIIIKGDWLLTPKWFAFSHFWSLSVEMQFYLLWPFVVYALPEKRLAIFCTITAAAAILTQNMLTGKIGVLGVYVSTVYRLAPLSAGTIIAVIFRNRNAWRYARIPACIITPLFLALLFMERTAWPCFYRFEMTFTVTAFCGMLIPVLDNEKSSFMKRFFESGILTFMGKYGYGLYILHHGLQPVWKRFIYESLLVNHDITGWTATIIYTVIAALLSISIAYLSWNFFEVFFLRLKRKFGYGRRAEECHSQKFSTG